MTTLDEEFCLLLEGVPQLEAELARGVLEAADIPCLIQGPDFDVAELGVAAHGALRGTNVYVPRQAEAAARKALEHAWPEEKAPEEE